jgi:tRNA isopentenyl-2-thiomethyl-A-37 hydroxylase MiaE
MLGVPRAVAFLDTLLIGNVVDARSRERLFTVFPIIL